jgi:hypothetical protein
VCSGTAALFLLAKNIFRFFVFSPCSSLLGSRGGKFFQKAPPKKCGYVRSEVEGKFFKKASSKRPAFLFKRIGGGFLRKGGTATKPLKKRNLRSGLLWQKNIRFALS